MAKILYYMSPYHGHINPTLRLVKELTNRGEKIIYYVTKPYEDLIRSTGAEVRCHPELDVTEDYAGKAYYLRYAQMLLPDLLEEARAERPDIVMFDVHAPWGWYIAQILRVPNILTSPTFAPNFGVLATALGFRQALLLRWALRQENKANAGDPTDAFSHILNALTKTYGVELPQRMQGDLHLYWIPASRQPAYFFYRLRPRKFGFVPMLREASATLDDDLAIHIETSKKKIYVSLGTVYNHQADFFRLCLEAFKYSDYRVVFSTGTKLDPDLLGSIPKHIMVREWVPQQTLLQHIDLHITHGGINSVNESLVHGVPLLIVPFMMEHLVTGKQVQNQKAGIMVNFADMNSGILLQYADMLLNNPTFRRNACRMGENLRIDGACIAANIIQRFIGVKNPI